MKYFHATVRDDEISHDQEFIITIEDDYTDDELMDEVRNLIYIFAEAWYEDDWTDEEYENYIESIDVVWYPLTSEMYYIYMETGELGDIVHEEYYFVPEDSDEEDDWEIIDYEEDEE